MGVGTRAEVVRGLREMVPIPPMRSDAELMPETSGKV